MEIARPAGSGRWWILGFACAGALGLLTCSPPALPAGVTVVSLGAGGAGARSGLRPGDVLLSWQRGGAAETAGVLRSCVDLATVERDEVPRGPVTLRAARRGQILPVEMAAGEWQAEVRPEPGDAVCAAFARGRRLTRERRWRDARAAFAETAAAAARSRGRQLFAVLALQDEGFAALSMEDFPGAEEPLAKALERSRAVAPGSLAEAASWHLLGRLDLLRGNLPRSEESFRHALDLRLRLAPASLETGSTLNNLGINAWRRGDYESARQFYRKALGAIRHRTMASLDEARVLNNLGLLSRDTGDLAAAQRLIAAAARIWQRIEPAGEDLARANSNLGVLASDRGDLAQSEEYHRKALARFEALAPDSLVVANLLDSLGMVALGRYELAEADALFRRALALQRRLAPGSADEAMSLSNMSWIAKERGHLDEAEALAHRALDLRRQTAPRSPSVALSLTALGNLAMLRGDLRRARALAEEALALQHSLAPGALAESSDLQFLGEVVFTQGDQRQAEALTRQALAIRRRLAPNSSMMAESLNVLGLTLEQEGRRREAGAAFAAAADAIEAQVGRLGDSDERRASFETPYGEIYRNLLALQVGDGDPAAALHTLERSRARSLLALLAERDLVFSDLPPALLDRQRRLDREYESVQEKIARLDPDQTAELEELLAHLTRLRGDRDTLTARIARASPHYASLRSPQPLDLAGIRRALDPGTVWLSYAVDEKRTFLFIVLPEGAAGGGPGVTVRTLPEGRAALTEEVAAFRSLILRGQEQTAAEPALLMAGRRLYDLLVAPAAAAIAGADRVLISPDGPLHILPFAALVAPAAGKAPSFLVEGKPLHTVLSATLWAEIRRGRRGPPGSPETDGPLVAFADPSNRQEGGDSLAVPTEIPLRRYRRGLDPLPWAREEVRSIAALWGGHAVTYVGAAASEERVKNLPVRPRYLHFACHALLDRRFPLDSALALATPANPDAGDNGLLQAWEIFERLRLDAELVTLSACETGLGRDAGGEGLIGLTRAFQYAGARSILASLWSVNDRSTAALMERFYALLRAGRPKDLALQEAQRALLRDARSAHPFHWAAFSLSGDWE